MINPFNIHKNKRYILGGRTIIIEDVLSSDIIWYDLCKWWNHQVKYPTLNSSPKFWFIMHVKNI